MCIVKEKKQIKQKTNNVVKPDQENNRYKGNTRKTRGEEKRNGRKKKPMPNGRT